MTFGMTIDCHTDCHTNTISCLFGIKTDFNQLKILKNLNINSKLINQFNSIN